MPPSFTVVLMRIPMFIRRQPTRTCSPSGTASTWSTARAGGTRVPCDEDYARVRQGDRTRIRRDGPPTVSFGDLRAAH